MGTPRLKAGFRAAAIIRRAQLAGHFAALVKRGDEDAGALLLQLEYADRRMDLLMEANRGDGARIWRCLNGEGPADAARAADLVAKEKRIDPDLWIIAVEMNGDAVFLDELVER